MKLVSISIQAFGKIKNFHQDFNSGLNVLQQSNGYGKSTICAFIRAMLYGLNYSRSKGVNDVVKYMPWDSTGKFGGSMIVSHQGQEYRIERFFGATEKHQSLSVVALATGAQQKILDVGEYFLGLTVDSYDRSVYYPQESVEIKSNDNFDAKLANFVEDTAVDYDALQKKLRAYKKALQYEKGDGGEIFQLKQQISKLERQLQQCKAQEQTRIQRKAELQQIGLELSQIENKIHQLNKQVESLQQQLYQCKPSQAEIDQANKLNDINLQIASVPKTVDSDAVLLDELVAKRQAMESESKKTSPKSKFAFIFFAVATVIVVTFLALSQFVVAGIVGGVSAVAGIVIGAKLKGKPTLEQLQSLDAKISKLASKYVNVIDKNYLQIADDFWKYHNDYQTALAVRDVLEKMPQSKNQSDVSHLTKQIDELKQTLSQLEERSKFLQRRQGQIEMEISQPIDSAVEVVEQLEDCKKSLAIAERKWQVADQTSQLLVVAKESLSSAYIPKLCQRCTALLNAITQGNYSLQTDRTFTLYLTEKGQTKPLSSFSRGIKEIATLCFRVAISQMFTDDKTPLLIVDDAFVNFDEQNFERATYLLKQLSQTTQVIYFTCHNRLGQF